NYNYKEGNLRLFLSQLSLAPAILSQQTPKNTTTFIATFRKSSREIRNFRPQLSQKRPAKSWGDCIVLNDSLTPVLPLSTPAKKVIISNVPPFIKDELIAKELQRHGQLVSHFRKI